MGGLLSAPVTNKTSDVGEGLGLRYGTSSMQGWRPEMEDNHDIKIGLDYGLKDWSFFAVFDGHSGKCASAFAALNLLEYILRDSRLKLKTNEWSGPKLVGPNGLHLTPASDEETTSESNPNVEANDEKATSEPETKCPESSGDTEASRGTEELQSTQKPPTTETQNTTDDELHDKSGLLESPLSTEQLVLVEKAIKSGFLEIDKCMRSNLPAKDKSGSTAVCSLISPSHIFIANCGDSRAVLFSEGKLKFATQDHKPYNPEERARIIDAGGTATDRINGALAVSRALGDFDFKLDELRKPTEQLVSPEPDVHQFERNSNDGFLVLACDGIWDVMTNEELVAYIEYKLMITPDLGKVCASVIDVCLRRGSKDNMSIIIVLFENAPKVSKEKIDEDIKNDETLSEIVEPLLTLDDFDDFISELLIQLENKSLLHILPPGAGIVGKYDMLRQKYESIPRERPQDAVSTFLTKIGADSDLKEE